VCDKEPVGHVKKEEIGMIPEARRASETADIKHELKHVIYSRRLAKGLDHLEIPTTADNKPTIEKLTKEEEEKRRLRRERNKVAASKCRERRRLKMERLSREAEDLIEQNKVLTTDIHDLQLEKDNLISKLRNHHCVLTASASSVDPTCPLGEEDEDSE